MIEEKPLFEEERSSEIEIISELHRTSVIKHFGDRSEGLVVARGG